MTRVVIGLLVAASLTTTTAQAQRLHVGTIDGPRGDWVAAELARRLEAAGVELADDEVADDAAVELSGRVTRRARRHVLRLRLQQGEATRALVFRSRGQASLFEQAVEGIVAHLAAAESEPVAAAPPPAPDEPEQEVTPPQAAAAPEGTTFVGLGDDEAMEYWIGLEWMTRTLSFTDDLFDRLGHYELPAALAITGGARWFPAQHWTSHPLAGFGVSGRFQAALGVSSSTPDGLASFVTTIDQFELGLVYRVRVAEMLRVEAAVEYGEARFRVDAAEPPVGTEGGVGIPSVHYRFVRPALAARLDLPEGFEVRAGAGWRAVVDSGPLHTAQWFPRSSTTGLDVSVDLRWRFHRWFAVRVHAEHVRYLTDIAPEPGDALVAGGAADEWTSAGADFVVIVPGAR